MFNKNLKWIAITITLILFTSGCEVVSKSEESKLSNSYKKIEGVVLEAKDIEQLTPYQVGVELTYPAPVADSTNGAVNLTQGWTQATQQEFYYTSQGSLILPYKWYLHLEQAANSTLFRSDENISRYGYIPSLPSKDTVFNKGWNPDGLSVGFVKTKINKEMYEQQGVKAKEWMGLTCAACHTTEIKYQDITMRVDGGPTLADFQSFNVDLVMALKATLNSEEKFKRFSAQILAEKNDAIQSADELRESLKKQIVILQTRNTSNVSHPDQTPYGYGRLDAVGAIYNQVLSVFNDDPLNARAANAPVSYPFIWGTHQSDVVQWTGFAPNGPLSIGALIRNGGEVLGVYGQININHSANNIGYPSSIDFIGLGRLESRVAQLRSPAWPFNIDKAKATAGQSLYKSHCAHCHQVIGRENEGKSYKAVLTPLSKVQTDPQEDIKFSCA